MLPLQSRAVACHPASAVALAELGKNTVPECFQTYVGLTTMIYPTIMTYKLLGVVEDVK